MTTYTGTADSNGNFNISFGGNSYIGAQKVTVTAAKDGGTKTVELFAPSDLTGGGVIQFTGNLTTFPNNIGGVTLTQISGAIGNNAFRSAIDGTIWSKATSLTIPNSVTSIGTSSFQGWSAATSLTIPSSVTSIGSTAFGSWSAATSLTIPSSVTSIGSDAFSGWSAATSLTIPSSITSIASGCFASWTSLLSLTIPSSVTSIAATAFSNLTACNEMICMRTTPPTITSTTFTNLKSTCVIKVPSASLTAYQTAANWSAHAGKMVGV